jgi:hypothetical protein
MSDHDTAAGIPAYIAGLSEFVRAHYERRIESIEDQADEISHRVFVLEEALATVKPRALSNAEAFYDDALISIAGAIEGSEPWIKNASILYQRAHEVAYELTCRTFDTTKEEHEAQQTPEADADPDLQAGHAPSH